MTAQDAPATPYDDACGKIRSGDLLLFRGHGPLAWLIRAWTRSRWSHVGVAWVANGHVLILETRGKTGVSVRRLAQSLPVDWISTGVAWTWTVEKYATSRLQESYSPWRLIELALGLPTNLKKFVCSTYAASVLAVAGIPIDAARQRPKDLAAFFMAAGRNYQTLG